MTEHESQSRIENTDLSAGQWLAKARKEHNLDVADVAGKLRLASRQIEAIEADDYQRLPGKTIVRGFVRNYARLLQLDAAQVVAAYEKIAPGDGEVRISVPHQNVQFSEVDSGHQNRSTLWMTLGLVILLAIGFLAWWLELRFAGAPKPAAPALIVPQGADGTPASASNPVESPSIATESSIVGNPPPSASPVAALSVPANLAEHVVHLAFEGEAWVEVRDANGKVVWQKTNSAGTEHDVTAPLPLSFTIGNPGQVKMTYNGDPYDLVPHVQGGIARFKLDR